MHPFALTPRAEGSPPADNGISRSGVEPLPLPPYESDIHCVSVIGQIEGHLAMNDENKTTRYEEILPQLIAAEQCDGIKGVLFLLHTVGGDVEAGLAIAEMIASLTKPTVSLVLGGGHSIGVPIAVAADHSLIAASAAMILHPIRTSGLVVTAEQSFNYLRMMQERVVRFIVSHSSIGEEELSKLMLSTGELAGDIGTIVVGREAVQCGLIDGVGGVGDALAALRAGIAAKEKEERKEKKK